MRTLYFFCFTLLLNCNLLAQDVRLDTGTLTSQFLNAVKEGNANTVQKLIATDFIIISFDGTATSGDVLVEGINGGYITFERANASNPYVRVYGETAIATGTWSVKGELMGNSFSNVLAYTIVCAKQGGILKVVSAHLTPTF